MCCRVVRRRNRWRYRIAADQKGARRRSAAGQSGRKRPTRAPDSNAAHPLLARQRVALARSPNFNAIESSRPNAEALASGRTTRTADIIGRKCRLHSRRPLYPSQALAICRACCVCCESMSRHGCNLRYLKAAVRPFECLGARSGFYFFRRNRRGIRCC